MRICSWKDGGPENELNQVVILAINLRLRNRCANLNSLLGHRALSIQFKRQAACCVTSHVLSCFDGLIVTLQQCCQSLPERMSTGFAAMHTRCADTRSALSSKTGVTQNQTEGVHKSSITAGFRRRGRQIQSGL